MRFFGNSSLSTRWAIVLVLLVAGVYFVSNELGKEVLMYENPEMSPYGEQPSRYYVSRFNDNVFYRHNSLGSSFVQLHANRNSFVVVSQYIAYDSESIFFDDIQIPLPRERFSDFKLYSCRTRPIFFIQDNNGDVFGIEGWNSMKNDRPELKSLRDIDGISEEQYVDENMFLESCKLVHSA